MTKVLYLGSDPACYTGDGLLTHYPLIRIVPRSINNEIRTAFDQFSEYTHILYTSKHAVQIAQGWMGFFQKRYEHQTVLAIGPSTLKALSVPALLPAEATQEGMIALLKTLDLREPFIFYPRSSLARPHLADYLNSHSVHHFPCDLYDTIPNISGPLPQIDQFDEIVFTSPSTVEAFQKIFGGIPFELKITSIGPITRQALDCVKRRGQVSSDAKQIST